MCPTRFSLCLVADCWLVATAAIAAQQMDTVSREGLVVSWEVQRSPGLAETRQLVDDSGLRNSGSLLGKVKRNADPACLELDGKSSVVAKNPIRPERLTLETVFRVDRTRGPLQLIVTTHPPKTRKSAEAVPGNSRQWFLQIRGEPPQQDGYLGFLEFGIFGEDGQWHGLMSQTRITKGWHHVIGTFDGKRVRLILDGQEQTRTSSGRSGSYEGRINQPPEALINLPAIGTNSIGKAQQAVYAERASRLVGEKLRHRSQAVALPWRSSVYPGRR
ncbi:MAG: LamG domain-containing protein [Rhodopirellula sp.]|nr:LamG domain-containing protein [Rhodopirellula sp.]